VRRLIAFNVNIPILGNESGVDSIVGTVESTPIIGGDLCDATCRVLKRDEQNSRQEISLVNGKSTSHSSYLGSTGSIDQVRSEFSVKDDSPRETVWKPKRRKRD